MGPRADDEQLATAPSTEDGPLWRALALSIAVTGLVFLPLVREGVGLYLYAFPLFGIGVVYVWQHRSRFGPAWWLTFVAITPLAVVALALDWAFSGHVLWNVLFLAHDRMVVKSRAWFAVFMVSLIHLVTLKVIFQRAYDVYGAGVSVVVAAIIVLVLRSVTAADGAGASRSRAASRSRRS